MGQKGGAYERDFCKRLSLWLSGTDDDLFWRSSMSGGRATVRSRQGKKTAGHYGDIVATDHRGRKFLKTFTLELKRGYNRCNTALSDLLDVPEEGKPQEIGMWIRQARESAKLAKSRFWLIVYKKDRRDEIVVMPEACFRHYFLHVEIPYTCYRGKVRTAADKILPDTLVFAVRSQAFFSVLRPRDFR